jgi:cytochrome b involved in lipid metabolism
MKVFDTTRTTTPSDTDETSGSTSDTSFDGNDGKREESDETAPAERFDRVAITEISIEQQVIMTIHGITVDVSSWARAHPGGEAILKRFHNRDASRAFDAVGHSEAAKALLQKFAIKYQENHPPPSEKGGSFFLTPAQTTTAAHWRRKLFTKEDPLGLHKSCGVYVLLHFLYRYMQAIFGDPSTGFGSRRGLGADPFSILLVLPHALLSLSSLIFHTVPRERVVGRPMIWVSVLARRRDKNY